MGNEKEPSNNPVQKFTLSIPGISHANERGLVSPTRRAIWLLLFVIGLALTAQAVNKVITEYWEYPIKTKVNMNLLCGIIKCTGCNGLFTNAKYHGNVVQLS